MNWTARLMRFVRSDAFALTVSGLCGALLLFAAGMAVARLNAFPYRQIVAVIDDVEDNLHRPLLWSLYRADVPATVTTRDEARMAPGLTLVSAFNESHDGHDVRIVAPDGETVHEWRINWNEIWPNPDHLPPDARDQYQKHLHGVTLADNGDLIFNFTELGMTRVDPCGAVVWRLPRRAHHAIFPMEDGSFWVPDMIRHEAPVATYPNHVPPFDEFLLLHVSADGEVLREFSINQMLIDNGLHGLLYMSQIAEQYTTVTTDTLHLNDVDVFPESMPEGVFKHGDIMVSLRNINTILVFDPATLRIRWISVGAVLRQHDPDFDDGDTISVFENNVLMSEPFDNANAGANAADQRSYITTISARENRVLRRFDGGRGGPFFTDLMGNHQRLPNGNMFIVEARRGRAFEVTADGDLVWDYHNILEPGLLGAISFAERLPEKFDRAFFAARTCPAS